MSKRKKKIDNTPLDFPKNKRDLTLLYCFLQTFLFIVRAVASIFNFIVWLSLLLRNRKFIVAYTDYPPWRLCIEEKVLSRTRNKAVIVKNWAFRNRREYPFFDRVAIMLATGEQSIPVIICFYPFSKAKCYLLREVLQAYQHGNPKPLDDLLLEVFQDAEQDAAANP